MTLEHEPLIEIPNFNIIRPLADQETVAAQLDRYNAFFEEHQLGDYETFSVGKSGAVLLGNKHLLRAARISYRFRSTPLQIIRDTLEANTPKTATSEVTVEVQSFDWLPRKFGFVFAAILGPEPIVSEHDHYVWGLTKLAGKKILPSERSNHVPIAYCKRELTEEQKREFATIAPSEYTFAPVEFVPTNQD